MRICLTGLLVFISNDSDTIVRKLENEIKSGVLGLKPFLNGTPTP